MKKFAFTMCAVAMCVAVQAQEKGKVGVAVAAPAKSQASKKVASSTVRAARPLAVTVGLTNGTEIRGTLADSTELPMRTSFGSASIPLAEVAGIRLASEGNATTTVVLHNGDTITGATELNKIVVDTEWGKAEVNGDSLGSILFAQGLKWTSASGLNGVRWSLVSAPQSKGQPIPSGARSTSRNIQPVNGIQSVNGVRTISNGQTGTRVFNGR